jgi:hypothetical protein
VESARGRPPAAHQTHRAAPRRARTPDAATERQHIPKQFSQKLLCLHTQTLEMSSERCAPRLPLLIKIVGSLFAPMHTGSCFFALALLQVLSLWLVLPNKLCKKAAPRLLCMKLIGFSRLMERSCSHQLCGCRKCCMIVGNFLFARSRGAGHLYVVLLLRRH